MFDPEQLLGQLLQTGLSRGLGRSRRRGGTGSLLGGVSTGAKAKIGMGLLGVAMAAYEHYTRQNGSVTGLPKASIPSTDATLLVQAMVAAAAADGVIDDAERAQMLKRAEDAGFDEETKRFLESELAQPKSLAVIAASARGGLAADLYAASCAAITADTDAERVYLETLAKRLGLTDDARAEIHRQLGLEEIPR